MNYHIFFGNQEIGALFIVEFLHKLIICFFKILRTFNCIFLSMEAFVVDAAVFGLHLAALILHRVIHVPLLLIIISLNEIILHRCATGAHGPGPLWHVVHAWQLLLVHTWHLLLLLEAHLGVLDHFLLPLEEFIMILLLRIVRSNDIRITRILATAIGLNPI